MSSGRLPVHGESPRSSSGSSPEYGAWRVARNKCFNPNARGVGFYGAHTPKMCPQWNDFCVFLADVGRRPSPRHQLRLIDETGDYEPRNVAWVERGGFT